MRSARARRDPPRLTRTRPARVRATRLFEGEASADALVGLVLVVMGRGQSRRLGFGVFGLMLAAVAVAWVLYYSDSTFTDVYRRSWAAVAARESDDSSKIVAAPAVKLERWWSGTGDDYGRPGVAVILAAALGVALIVRQRLAGAGLVFVAWLFA